MAWKKGSDNPDTGDPTKYKQDRDPNDGSWKSERITINPETGQKEHEWIKGSTEGEIKSGVTGENVPRTRDK